MNRNFGFALILLAMLSIINAISHQLYKRKTKFGACPFSGVPSVLNVTISPDPVVKHKFTISGSLK